MEHQLPTTPDHGGRAHLRFSASQWSRLLHCTGPIFYESQLPPEEPTPESLEGETFHELLEVALEDFLEHRVSGSHPEFRFQVLAKNYEPYLISDVRIGVQAIWEKGLENTITGKAYGFEELFQTSKTLQIGGIGDFWCVGIDSYGKRFGLVVDYKYGKNYVSEKNNSQLACLSTSLLKEFPKLDYIRAVIYQPRSGEEAWREVTFTPNQLKTWENRFLRIASKYYSTGKPTFKVGEWCQNCKARSICKTYREDLNKRSAVLLGVENTGSVLPTAESTSKEARLKIVAVKDALIDYINECYALELGLALEAREAPAGFKVIEGRAGNRKFISEDRKVIDTLANLGVNPTETVMRKVTAVEEDLTENYGKKEAKNILANLTERGIPSKKLVPEGAKGEPLQLSHAQLLGESTNED